MVKKCEYCGKKIVDDDEVILFWRGKQDYLIHKSYFCRIRCKKKFKKSFGCVEIKVLDVLRK